MRERYELLTPRERQVVTLVTSGLMNKLIAMHRSGAMRKLRTKSVVGLTRIAQALTGEPV